MDQPALADLDPAGIGSARNDLADGLVSHGQRQLDAAVGDGETLAAAEIEIAVGNVQIAVAHAGGQHLEQHLAAGGRRGRVFGSQQRRAAFANLEASHL